LPNTLAIRFPPVLGSLTVRWMGVVPLAGMPEQPVASRDRSVRSQGPYLPRSALGIPRDSDTLAGALAHSVEDKDSHIYALPFG